MSFELKVLLLSIAVTVYLIIFNTLPHRNTTVSVNVTRCGRKFIINNNVLLKEMFDFGILAILAIILKYQSCTSQTL